MISKSHHKIIQRARIFQASCAILFASFYSYHPRRKRTSLVYKEQTLRTNIHKQSTHEQMKRTRCVYSFCKVRSFFSNDCAEQSAHSTYFPLVLEKFAVFARILCIPFAGTTHQIFLGALYSL